jgi:hypothetical protein
MSSPYHAVVRENWNDRTRDLIDQHPLDEKEIVEVVLSSWESIFKSALGEKGFRIGEQIFPKPQIMGFLLHELIPLEFAARYPGVWRAELSADDKDMVYIPDSKYSVEIKTSSAKGHIYGNRSYAQETQGDKKSKSGYYIAINFEKFTKTRKRPRVALIRFGWLDHTDWMGQKAASGQQARLDAFVEQVKLHTLYRA